MYLKDISTANVITIRADDSIDKAIQLLELHRVRHLAVVRDGLPVGMVSAGDVLAGVGGLLSDERVSTRDATVPYAGPTFVEQVMSTDLFALSPDGGLATAARLMLERGIAAVLLVSDKNIVGIVTETDYLRLFCDGTSRVPDSFRQQPVANHMKTEVVTAAPDDNVFTLMREMGKRIHHLPVLEDGKLIGILSGHDIRKALARDSLEKILEPDAHIRLAEHFDARQIMNHDVQTTTPGATLAEAAERMIEHKIGALVVLEAGDLAGIITETDLLQAFVTAQED